MTTDAAESARKLDEAEQLAERISELMLGAAYEDLMSIRATFARCLNAAAAGQPLSYFVN